MEESEGSPMVGVGVLGGQMRGEKEKIEGINGAVMEE